MTFHWATETGRAMGSGIDVMAWGTDPEPAARWALAEAERLEAAWSRFRVTSELSHLNRSAGHGPFACSDLLWSALVRARRAWEATGGLFDPTVHDALVALGYDRTFADVASDDPAAVHPVRVPGFDLVRLDDEARTATLPAGVAVDLGGIGKGLAADLLVEGLRQRGVTSGQVAMGGDVRVFGRGPDDDDAWMIDVEHPDDDRVMFRFPLVDEAIVQSTRAMRRWRRGGRSLHHLVDPRTGLPAEHPIVSVVATAPEAWFAEAVAKAVFVAGERDGLTLALGSGVDVWIVRDDGILVTTPDVADSAPGDGRATS